MSEEEDCGRADQPEFDFRGGGRILAGVMGQSGSGRLSQGTSPDGLTTGSVGRQPLESWQQSYHFHRFRLLAQAYFHDIFLPHKGRLEVKVFFFFEI